MNFFGKSPFRISFYGGGTDIEPYPSDFVVVVFPIQLTLDVLHQ